MVYITLKKDIINHRPHKIITGGIFHKYAFLKRKVFSLDLNESRDGASLTLLGKSFHRLAAANSKERSPYLTVLVLGIMKTVSWLDLVDLLLFCNCSRSDRY